MLAHKLTEKEIYYKTSQQALRSFAYDIADGGVRIQDSNGGWWYEHFAEPKLSNPSRTLNAMAYSLASLWNYYEYTNDALAKELFDRGILTLKEHLPEYDAGFYSYYDAHKTVASPPYHHENINSLLNLHRITKEPLFLEYAERWQADNESLWGWAQRQYLLERHFILRQFVDNTPSKIDWLILMASIVPIWIGIECAALIGAWGWQLGYLLKK